jgi:hypothetical protein
MRRKIEQSVYDTDAPGTKMIASAKAPSSQMVSELHHRTEELYRSMFGNWFIVGVGGSLTPYASRDEKGLQVAGTKLLALSPSDARLWLYEHGFTAEIEKYFGVK